MTSILARQLTFNISSTKGPLGVLNQFDWGSIEANELRNPSVGSRNLSFISNSSEFTLFVDGQKPFRSESECPVSSKCPINCPASELNAAISRSRRSLLCLRNTATTHSSLPRFTLKLTCSVPCPAWQPAAPRLVWLENGIPV